MGKVRIEEILSHQEATGSTLETPFGTITVVPYNDGDCTGFAVYLGCTNFCKIEAHDDFEKVRVLVYESGGSQEPDHIIEVEK